MKEIPFTSIEGIIVGHCNEGNSGCTVVLSENSEGFGCGVDCRGGATGTRETDLLKPGMLVEKIHGCVISGGSAFGLDASSGVMKYFREKGIGYHTDILNVPIVCQAVLYDLQMLNKKDNTSLSLSSNDNNNNNTSSTSNNQNNSIIDLPNYFELGYKACKNPISNDINGNIGAGNGSTIGKLLGAKHSMKGGLGCYAIQVDNELKIGAMVAVNCFGDVYENGNLIAGCYKINDVDSTSDSTTTNTSLLSDSTISTNNTDDTSFNSNNFNNSSNDKLVEFLDSEKILIKEYLQSKEEANAFELSKRKHDITNTTIGIVVCNGILDKSQLNRIAMMAHDGYARSMKPSHTLYDGDTIFVISTGTINVKPPTNLIGTLAAQVVEKAVVNGVKHAQSMNDFISFNDLNNIISTNNSNK
ncbi:predicted protein [Naegleria gruberi]|uniref:Predicted protein n=1 Tax=Naegleria gruberi TaxID=5762 RepID=D2W1D7_NAEGR|nr:uncharacterized protein NAEGRDRAFT_75180 [Naegleria gruberi]EFC37030.1 predicted protein [Naegleria gruberi]|eukprot:XP_002669774.1 predicted protein [Naegleria gruberi strain NEG-M]